MQHAYAFFDPTSLLLRRLHARNAHGVNDYNRIERCSDLDCEEKIKFQISLLPLSISHHIRVSFDFLFGNKGGACSSFDTKCIVDD